MRLVLIFSLFMISVVHAESIWRVEIQTGSAHSFDTTLSIDQTSGPSFEFSADYETRPFTSAPYSDWRVSRWVGEAGWELEFLHHKIYLKNTPPGIETFRMTNGYNFLLLNRAWEVHGFVLRAGGGVIIPFPISKIGDTVTDGGYRLAGAGAQAAIGRRFSIGSKFFLAAEAKITLGYAHVDLNGGADASVPNVAFHGLAGLGYTF